MDPSPGPWAFHTHVYGLSNAVLDRDGRVINCHLPAGNGALISKAPAMADLFNDLLAGATVEELRPRVAAILRQIERYRRDESRCVSWQRIARLQRRVQTFVQR